MFLFIAIWFFLLLFSLSGKVNKPLLWTSVIFLSLIAGLRHYTVGVDTVTYREIFNIVKATGGAWVETGWVFLNKIVIWFGGGYNLLLTVSALLTIGMVTFVALKCSPNPHFSLFIYYSMYAYFNSFNMIRQSLAISFVLLSYYFLQNRKHIKFTLSVLVGMSMHLTAVMGFLAVIVKAIKLNNTLFYLGIVGSLVAGIFVVNDGLLHAVMGPYASYLESEDFGYRDNLLSAVIMAVLFSLIVVFVYETSVKKNIVDNFWFKLFWLSACMTNGSLKLVLGTRMIIYFTIVQVIVFPIYLDMKKKDKLLCQSLIVLYLLVVFLKMLILGKTDNFVYPYKTFLSS